MSSPLLTEGVAPVPADLSPASSYEIALMIHDCEGHILLWYHHILPPFVFMVIEFFFFTTILIAVVLLAIIVKEGNNSNVNNYTFFPLYGCP